MAVSTKRVQKRAAGSSAVRLNGRRLPAQIRAAIRNSDASARAIAKRYRVNLKTVLRWRNRDSCEARKPPRRDESTPFTQVLAVGLRRFARLSLDDCVHVLRTASPGPSRASIHRCFRRYGVSRLPEVSVGRTPMGWFDVHVIPLGQDQRPACLYLGIERQSRFIFADVADTAKSSADFLQALQKASPVTVLGVCVERSGRMTPQVQQEIARACAGSAIRCKTVAQSWPGDRENTLELSLRACAGRWIGDIDALKSQIGAFLVHFNHRSRLKTLGGLTPAAYIERQSVGATSPGMARREDFEATASMRERILDCARSLLSSAGPEGMSLSKVARMAGVNRGTIYHHFATRSELLAVAAEWSSEQLTNAVFGEPFDAGGMQPGPGNVLRVIRRLANFAIRNPEMSQAWLLQIISMPDPSKDRFWREYYGRSLRFQQTPVPAQDMDPEVLAVITLAGAFLWPMWARAKSGGEANLQRYADRYIREFFRLTIHGTLRAEYVRDVDAELQAMRSQS